MALFGAIVLVGLGPALWLGAQFAQAGQLPGRPPITADYVNPTAPAGDSVPESSSGTQTDGGRQKPRIVPAGPPARGIGGAAEPLTPSPSRTPSPVPSASATPSASVSVSVSASATRSAAPSAEPTTAAPDPSTAATNPLKRTPPPIVGNTVPIPSQPDARPNNEPGSLDAVQAAHR